MHCYMDVCKAKDTHTHRHIQFKREYVLFDDGCAMPNMFNSKCFESVMAALNIFISSKKHRKAFWHSKEVEKSNQNNTRKNGANKRINEAIISKWIIYYLPNEIVKKRDQHWHIEQKESTKNYHIEKENQVTVTECQMDNTLENSSSKLFKLNKMLTVFCCNKQKYRTEK